MQTFFVCSTGLLLLLCLRFVHGVVFRDCGSIGGKIVSFKADKCLQRHRCDLTPGTNQSIEMVFESLVKSHTLTAEAFSIIGGRSSKFNMPNRDVCRYEVSCPIQPNEHYTYRTSVYIDPKFPRVAMVVKWQLKGDDNKDVICIMVPAKIV